MLKTCFHCKISRPTEDFPKDKSTLSGLGFYCKECKQNYERKRYKENATRRKNIWSNNIKRRFGISEQDYEELFKKQKGACAICGEIWTDGKRLAVDHDHTKGQVRGLLCAQCNQAIGFFKENPSIFVSAMYYLEKGGVK